jgi:hypothetical protein
MRFKILGQREAQGWKGGRSQWASPAPKSGGVQLGFPFGQIRNGAGEGGCGRGQDDFSRQGGEEGAAAFVFELMEVR